MEEIVITLKYRELCSLKHALKSQINAKYEVANNSNGVEREKAIKEMLEEQTTINYLEKMIVENKHEVGD